MTRPVCVNNTRDLAGRAVHPSRGRMLTLLGAILLAIAMAACGESSNEGAAEAVEGTQVSVVDNDFEPSNLQVKAGDTVTWTWEASNDHNVVGDTFESDVQQSGTFTHTFDDAGEYEYVCTLHAGMNGAIVVAEA